jgi:hypothetical protein
MKAYIILFFAAAALCGCAAPRSFDEEATVAQKEPSQIFVMKGTDGTDGGFKRLIAVMEENGAPFYKTELSPGGIIAADDVVLLKINCQWAERGGTNTDLIRAVAEAVSEHPDGFTGEIVIADNGQKQYGSGGKGGNLDWEHANSQDHETSALDVVKSLKSVVRISGYLWDDITLNRVDEFSEGDYDDGFVIEDKPLPCGIKLSYPKFTTEYDTKISFKNGVWDGGEFDGERLKVINMPVLKSHIQYHATGAIKSYMGTTSDKLVDHTAHNSVGKGGMGAQMAGTRAPALNVMDMIWVGAALGPFTTYDTATQKNIVATSKDPVALDYWAVKHVLLPELETLVLSDTASVDPDIDTPGSFGYWLRLSAEALNAAGVLATTDEEQIIVFVSGG